MSFEAFMAWLLFLTAPVLLGFFLVKGVALPTGPVVKAGPQPLRFAAYCALYLVPILFQAFLYYREHPIARESVWLLICAGNMIGTLRWRREHISSLSKYEFAAPEPSFTHDRPMLIFWLIMGCFWLVVIVLMAVAGKYPALF